MMIRFLLLCSLCFAFTPNKLEQVLEGVPVLQAEHAFASMHTDYGGIFHFRSLQVYSQTDFAYQAEGARFYGYPEDIGFAFGTLDLSSKNHWGMFYSYRRIGWSTNDLLFASKEAEQNTILNTHLGTLAYQWQKYLFHLGWSGILVDHQAKEITLRNTHSAFAVVSKGSWGISSLLRPSYQWVEARWELEKNKINGAGFGEYAPRLYASFDSDKHWKTRIEQNLYAQQIYVQYSKTKDLHWVELNLYADPTRFFSLDLALLEVDKKRTWGAQVRLGPLKMGYNMPSAIIDRGLENHFFAEILFDIGSFKKSKFFSQNAFDASALAQESE